ncbi:MAG: hypothetical protein ABI720_12765 [Actinomycetes bacterium]
MSHDAPRFYRQVAGATVALALAAGLGVAVIVHPSSATPLGDQQALGRTSIGPNLIKNPGFADGFKSWSPSKAKTGALRVSRGGVWGSRKAAVLQPRHRSTAVLRDARSTAPRSVDGMQYQASAWVKASGRSVNGVFRLEEWKGGEVASSTGERFSASTKRWSRVTFLSRAKQAGGFLQLSLTANRVGGELAVKVDRIGLHPVKRSSPTPDSTDGPTDPSPSASASTSPEPTSSTTSSPSPTTTVPPSSGGTLFGASVYESGRTWTKALADSHETYGGMEVVRAFYPGLPSAWPGRAGQVNGPVVVSFKANPVDILSGKHDAYLSNWFATAPKDREIWWTYWHEPEDDVERGGFTAQQWRDAYRRIAGMADAAKNPNLYNTVILMCWTVNPRSGRSFDDFFPGGDVVEAIGWDCYSVANSSVAYAKPEEMYGRALATTSELGLAFGVAETGSLLAPTDPDGVKRAEWLGSIGRWLGDRDASFVCYFDSVVGGEFRLQDVPSQQAWRQVVTGVGDHDPI